MTTMTDMTDKTAAALDTLDAPATPFNLNVHMHRLLLDEPFSHLDPDNTRTCISLIREICRERDAGLFLTTLDDDHDLRFDEELRV